MNKKRILILVPRMNIGGAETYAANIARALKINGHQVYIASGGGILAKQLQLEGIRHFFLPMRWSTDLSAYLLTKIVMKNQIDLIHANSAAAGITAVKLRTRYLNIPIIFTAHGSFGHNKQEMTLNYCDKIICVSEFLRQDSIRRGFDPSKLVTLYSGIDINKFTPSPCKENKVRKLCNIPENAFTLIIVSRIKNIFNKGHMDLMEILRTYPNAASWHLVVVGSGSGLYKLKYYIQRYNLQNRVHCIGHKTEVQEWLNEADVLVLPSYFETFGLVLAEGMAMKKPVIAYSVGGTPEVIENGKSGFLVQYKNIGDFNEKLLFLEKKVNARLSMGEYGRARVQHLFSLERMLHDVLSVYDEVISMRRE